MMARKSGVKIVDRDKGFNKFLQQAKELSKNSQVAIGVRGQDASEKKTGSTDTGAKFTPMQAPSLADVATWMEYGTERNGGHVPERSYIRSTMTENHTFYVKMMVTLAMKVLDPKSPMPVETALGLAGEKVKMDVMNKIRSNIPPALSPQTTDRKGSTTALIDTGQLINAITYDVRLNNKYKQALRKATTTPTSEQV